jgi:hypothetical protein
MWASGAKELDDAAGRITQAVFDLGKSLVTYCSGSSYADDTFDCTSFLSLFRDHKGLGQTLNCSDCATIVSTFANALGCDLWQSRIDSNHIFTTNYIRLIGEPSFDKVDFAFHEVAWKDECSFNNDLFDACLELDDDGKPTRPPETAVLAVKMIFGTSRTGGYRFRLAPPLPDFCQPAPDKRQRRAIGLNTPPQKDCTTEPLPNVAPHSDNQAGNIPLIFSGNVAISSWELYRLRLLKRTDLLFGAYTLWFLPEADPECLIRLDYKELKSANAAEREKQRLLERYQIRPPRQYFDLNLRTIDFISVTKGAFLGRTGAVVVEVRSVGRTEVDIKEFTEIVSQTLNP